MRTLGAVLLAIVLTGCIGFGGCNPSFRPLPLAEIGPMLTDPDGGPTVECRDLPVWICEGGFHALDGPRPIADEADVDRIVVSCVGVCGAGGGETRMDVIFTDGTTELLANGGYGEFEQSCV